MTIFLIFLVLIGGSIGCVQAYEVAVRLSFFGRTLAVLLTAAVAVAFGIAAYIHEGQGAIAWFVTGIVLIAVIGALAISKRDSLNL